MQCPSCRKEVSVNAAACPHCGEPRPGAAELAKGQLKLWGLIILAFVAWAVWKLFLR